MKEVVLSTELNKSQASTLVGDGSGVVEIPSDEVDKYLAGFEMLFKALVVGFVAWYFLWFFVLQKMH